MEAKNTANGIFSFLLFLYTSDLLLPAEINVVISDVGSDNAWSQCPTLVLTMLNKSCETDAQCRSRTDNSVCLQVFREKPLAMSLMFSKLIQVTPTSSYCKCKSGYQPLQPDKMLCVEGEASQECPVLLSPCRSSPVLQPPVPNLSGQSLYSPPSPRLPPLFHLQTLLQNQVAAEVMKTNRNVADH